MSTLQDLQSTLDDLRVNVQAAQSAADSIQGPLTQLITDYTTPDVPVDYTAETDQVAAIKQLVLNLSVTCSQIQQRISAVPNL